MDDMNGAESAVNRKKSLAKKILITVVVLFVAFMALGVAAGGLEDTKKEEEPVATVQTENKEETKKEEPKEVVAETPKINEADYQGKEGLVAFKELSSKNYNVTAKYENEKLPAASRDMTEAFKNADVNKCEDRLGFDAYIVSKLSQDGEKISLILDNEPNNNQTCPDGSTYQP